MPVLVPVNVTTLLLAVKLPASVQLPLSLIFEIPEAVTLPPIPMVSPSVVQPEFDEASMVTAAACVPCVTVELPVTERSLVPIPNVPDDTVKAPLTTALSCSAYTPVPSDELRIRS